MGIIDDDRSTFFECGDELEPARDAGQMGESLGRRRHRDPCRHYKAERRQCVHRLESPGKRQHQLAALSKEIEEQSLAADLRLAIQKTQISGWVAAVGKDRMTR